MAWIQWILRRFARLPLLPLTSDVKGDVERLLAGCEELKTGVIPSLAR